MPASDNRLNLLLDELVAVRMDLSRALKHAVRTDPVGLAKLNQLRASLDTAIKTAADLIAMIDGGLPK